MTDLSGGRRPVTWSGFVQRVRAHRPQELLEALAAVSSADFTGGPIAPRAGGWNQWAVAAVARESIAYGSDYRRAPVTERALSRILQAHNDLEDPFVNANGKASPWDFFLRTVYQQFSTGGSVYPELARFAAVFDRPFPTKNYKVLGATALRSLLGASVTDYLGATFLFTIGAQINQGLFDLDWIAQPQFEQIVSVIPEATLNGIFREKFGAAFNQVRAAACAHRNPDPALRVHDFNPLIATPYVGLTATQFIAPLPRLVADRASLAAVYHLGVKQYGQAFTGDLGRLVEAYAGEHLRLVPQAITTPDREYKTGQRSVDWVVVLPNVVVLVEVKSARVNQAGRLSIAAYLEDVNSDVGKAMKQVHATADLIRTGHPAFDDIPIDRPLRGIIVTAEPHYLINSPLYRQGLPDPSVPTVVLTLGELENLVSFALVRNPNDVLLSHTDWTTSSPVNVTRLQNEWFTQHQVKPQNPLLYEAWNRMPLERGRRPSPLRRGRRFPPGSLPGHIVPAGGGLPLSVLSRQTRPRLHLGDLETEDANTFFKLPTRRSAPRRSREPENLCE